MSGWTTIDRLFFNGYYLLIHLFVEGAGKTTVIGALSIFSSRHIFRVCFNKSFTKINLTVSLEILLLHLNQ